MLEETPYKLHPNLNIYLFAYTAFEWCPPCQRIKPYLDGLEAFGITKGEPLTLPVTETLDKLTLLFKKHITEKVLIPFFVLSTSSMRPSSMQFSLNSALAIVRSSDPFVLRQTVNDALVDEDVALLPVPFTALEIKEG